MSPSVKLRSSSIASARSVALRSSPSREDARRCPHIGNILLALGSVIVCILGSLLVTPVARITPENCARIKPGMTQEQVESILGGPPDWYDGMGAFQYGPSSPTGKWADGLDWAASHGDVEVVFDGKGRVVKSTFYPGQALEIDLCSFVVERLTRRTWRRWERGWEMWWIWG